MTRVRRNATVLSRNDDWPDELVAYEKAVDRMRKVEPGDASPTDPTGWRFQAAMHGRQLPDGRPDQSNPLFNQCQHGSWFFLPWHRMYLAAFERMVQHHLDDESWSLPYWYAIDPDHPQRSILPPAFRDTTKRDNDLHTTHRARRVNAGKPIYGAGFPRSFLDAGLGDALTAGRYATADGVTAFGGGKRARPSFSGPEQGLLEGTPHGTVHVLVGGPTGWMSSFFTAALDPIFWLHHANLDRLWQVWLDLGHRDPRRQRAWMDTKFSFPAPDGGTLTWSVAEVLDTTALGYTYDDLEPPSGVAAALKRPAPQVAPETPAPQSEVVRLRRQATPVTEDTDLPTPPRVVGAVDDVDLTSSAPVTIPVRSGADAGIRTYLRIEGVTGTAAVPAYSVYLDVPAGDAPDAHPELRAGTVATFGLEETSVAGDLHDGDGLTVVLDVTPVRAVLEGDGRWDDGAVVVTFVAADPADEDDEETPGQPDAHARRLALVTSATG